MAKKKKNRNPYRKMPHRQKQSILKSLLSGNAKKPFLFHGDYYGFKTGDVPSDYLHWMVRKVTDPIWKANAAAELARRKLFAGEKRTAKPSRQKPQYERSIDREFKAIVRG